MEAGQLSLKSNSFLILAAWPGLAGLGLAWPGLSIVGGFLAGQPGRFGGLGNFFLKSDFFSQSGGLAWACRAWPGLASQSWGGSWPAGLADLEAWAIFFLNFNFFSHSGDLAWAGLGWPGQFFHQLQFFSHSGQPVLGKNLILCLEHW